MSARTFSRSPSEADAFDIKIGRSASHASLSHTGGLTGHYFTPSPSVTPALGTEGKSDVDLAKLRKGSKP